MGQLGVKSGIVPERTQVHRISTKTNTPAPFADDLGQEVITAEALDKLPQTSGGPAVSLAFLLQRADFCTRLGLSSPKGRKTVG